MIKVIEQGSYMNRVDKLPDGRIQQNAVILAPIMSAASYFISMRAGWRQ